MKEWLTVFKAGLSLDNPLTVLMVGLCSTLAVSTRVEGSLFMGAAVMFVLLMSNVIISSTRKLIPPEVRIPVFIVVIASFVTIVDLTMKAYLPSVYAFLGVWIPLIVVNCIVLGRAEGFAYHHGVRLSAADALGMGAGFSIVIVLLAAIRELLGTGSIIFFGTTLASLPSSYQPPSILVLFPGAFMVFALLVAGAQALNRRIRAREEARTS